MADVTEDLSGHRFIRIVANRLDFDGHAGQVVSLFFNLSDDILREVIGQDRRHVRTLYLLNLLAQLIFRHVEDACQFRQFLIAHAALRRYISRHEARSGADQDLTVAVIHDAAHGRNGDGPQAVPFGQGVIIFTGKKL